MPTVSTKFALNVGPGCSGLAWDGASGRLVCLSPRDQADAVLLFLKFFFSVHSQLFVARADGCVLRVDVETNTVSESEATTSHRYVLCLLLKKKKNR